MINKETLGMGAFRLTDDSIGEPPVFEDLPHDASVNMGADPDRGGGGAPRCRRSFAPDRERA